MRSLFSFCQHAAAGGPVSPFLLFVTTASSVLSLAATFIISRAAIPILFPEYSAALAQKVYATPLSAEMWVADGKIRAAVGELTNVGLPLAWKEKSGLELGKSLVGCY